MSQPPPHGGQSLGFFRCVHKSATIGNRVRVFFEPLPENENEAFIQRLGTQDASYFAVGQAYEFRATAP